MSTDHRACCGRVVRNPRVCFGEKTKPQKAGKNFGIANLKMRAGNLLRECATLFGMNRGNRVSARVAPDFSLGGRCGEIGCGFPLDVQTSVDNDFYLGIKSRVNDARTMPVLSATNLPDRRHDAWAKA